MAHVQSINYARNLSFTDTWCVVLRWLCCVVKAGWEVMASSDGTTKVTGTTIATQNLVPLANVGGGGTGAATTAKENSTFVTITGLSGLVAPTFDATGWQTDPGNEGDFLTFTGFATSANNGTFQIVEVISATSCKIRNVGGVAGNTGGAWQLKSTTTSVYNSATWSGKAPWAVLGGPKTVRVEVFGAAPTLAFGEEVLQGTSTTQRRGRLLSYVFDASTGQPTSGMGWLVIEPCDDGTWDTSTITGVSTGKTVTPSATPKVFRVFMVVGKQAGGYLNGFMAWQHIDIVGESSQGFHAIAASDAACTASVPPGKNGSQLAINGTPAVTSFPPTGLMITGQARANVTPMNYAAGDDYFFFNSSSMGTNAQILCVNCLPRPADAGRNVESRSCSDGSWWMIVMSSTADAVVSPLTFQRLDACEDGEVSPYASGADSSHAPTFFDRFRSAQYGTTVLALNSYLASYEQAWRGYAARGSGTVRDISMGFFMGSSYTLTVGDNWTAAEPALPARHVNHPAATPPLRREGWMLKSRSNLLTVENVKSVKMDKGVCRWFVNSGLGPGRSTYGARWFALFGVATPGRAALAGPLDGVTTPVN